MNKYEPEYISYKKRIVKTIAQPILTALFYFILFYFFYPDAVSIAIITVVFVSIISISISVFIKRSKKYLKSISFDDKEIELVIYDKDTIMIDQKFLSQDVRIKVVDLFNSKYRRKFKLQIDIFKEGKFQTIINQYEIGSWNLDLFRRVYESYCNNKETYYNESSLERLYFK